MKENPLNIINRNNKKINSLIQDFINTCPESAFAFDSAGNSTLSPDYKKIIELEINKVLQIYHLEFPNIPFDANRNLSASAYNSNHCDAHYENDVEYFNTGIKNPIEIFYFIAHETAHAFGFPGNFWEGVTESFSRQVASKYGLLSHFNSRQDLVELTEKIEKVIGRDNLASLSNNIDANPENITKLSHLIDTSINPDTPNMFANLYYSFEESSNYLNDLEQRLLSKFGNTWKEHLPEIQTNLKQDSTLKDLKEKKLSLLDNFNYCLDNYIQKNPSKLFEIGQSNLKGSNKDFDSVIRLQENEITFLNQLLQKSKMKNQKNNFINSLQCPSSQFKRDNISYSSKPNVSKNNKHNELDEKIH